MGFPYAIKKAALDRFLKGRVQMSAKSQTINIGDKIFLDNGDVITLVRIEERCGEDFRDEPYEVAILRNGNGLLSACLLLRKE